MTCYEFESTRYVRARHFAECDGAEGCAGCLRCPEAHCGECRKGAHLGFGENTCPECVGKVRATLRSLLDLYAALPAEAEVRGATSEAANLHGPATDAEAWSYRKAARSLRLGVPMSTLEDDDTNHPVFVLDGWIRALGEDYADHPDRQLTLSEAVGWIDKRLGRIANDAGQDFGQFRREVGHCKAHMEAVLHDGEQRDVTRVPCLDCGRRLERRYGTLAKEDHHICPNRSCDRDTYTHNEFVMAKRQWLDDEGADRHVKMQDARDVIDRPKRTWNKWLRYWYVRSYRDAVTGQVWIWWPDARDMERSTPRRNRVAA